MLTELTFRHFVPFSIILGFSSFGFYATILDGIIWFDYTKWMSNQS